MKNIPIKQTITNESQQDHLTAGVERYETDVVNLLYYKVWGDSIHFGMRISDDCTFEEAAMRTKRHIATSLLLTPEHHVLEVASGVGETARFFAREYGCAVTATNKSDQHLSESLKRAKTGGLDHLVTNAWADFHDLPFDDQTFDGYWVQEGFVHAMDKARMLSEAFRVLKPGARLVISEQTTETKFMSTKDRERAVQRHGSSDLLNADGVIRALINQGFTMIRDDDMSIYIAPQFEALVQKIEQDYGALTNDIPNHIVDWNLNHWRWAVDLAHRGAIGWHIFVAERPSLRPT
jgi:sarcosine/dimethylglycine N-methyltransferase